MTNFCLTELDMKGIWGDVEEEKEEKTKASQREEAVCTWKRGRRENAVINTGNGAEGLVRMGDKDKDRESYQCN